jgi:type II secretory pathway component GspD/PulD (secretin)
MRTTCVWKHASAGFIPCAFIVTDMIREALGLVLTLISFAALGQQSLEVISLRYRTADQVLDTLRPLVEPGGALTGQGNQLIVRVSPANLAEIRRVLDAIDRPQRRLQISVRFDDAFDSSRRDLEVGGSVSNRGVVIEGSARDSQRNRADRADYRVQAMDGGRATILMEEGVVVVPRVSGNMVTMQIVTTNTRQTVSGPVGEWFELGAIDRTAARSERGIGSTSQGAATGTRRVWVKVDALD